METMVEHAPDRIAEIRGELIEVAAPHDAFDAVATVSLVQNMASAETLTPLAGSNLPAAPAAEYLAHLLVLDRTSRAPTTTAPRDEIARGIDAAKVIELVAEVFGLTPLWRQYRMAGSEHRHDIDLEIRSRLLMQRAVLPSLDYPWVEEDLLLELFGPFAAELQEACGYDVADAVAVARCIPKLTSERFTARMSHGRSEADRIMQRVHEVRSAKADAGDHDEFFARLAALKPKHAKRRIRELTTLWVCFGLGHTMQLVPDEVAAVASMDETRARAVFGGFSFEFGTHPEALEWHEDLGRHIGSELFAVRDQPLLDDGEGHYLPASPYGLLWSSRQKLEAELKKDGGGRNYQRFQEHRRKLLEHRSLAALDAALDPEWAYGAVQFDLPEDDGVRSYEADGVLRAGTVVVLLEAKAGSMSRSAQRAAPARLERTLKDLVVAASEQLGRAERGLVRGEARDVRDADGKHLELDLENVTRVVRIAVTLEDLSPIGPNVWMLEEAGILPKLGSPWVVRLQDLELICRLCERPAQLVHYLARRARVNAQKVWAMDELDWWMYYLQKGLYFENDELSSTLLQLASFTDQLDAWVYGERGLSPASERPRQKLHRDVRRLLDALDQEHGSETLEAQVAILEMDEQGRRRVATALRRLPGRSRKDGRFHDETLIFDDEMAITVMSAPTDNPDELLTRLRTYGRLKKHQLRVPLWVGFGSITDEPQSPQLALVMKGDHVRDEELERLVEEWLPSPPS